MVQLENYFLGCASLREWTVEEYISRQLDQELGKAMRQNYVQMNSKIIKMQRNNQGEGEKKVKVGKC